MEIAVTRQRFGPNTDMLWVKCPEANVSVQAADCLLCACNAGMSEDSYKIICKQCLSHSGKEVTT